MSSTRPLADERAISSQPSRQAPCALPGTPLAEMRSGIDACVHCGFCLQSCPTYLTLEDENDSPRGRVLLMRSALEGSIGLGDPVLETHIDRCLGCRACETACPSGVPYGHLLEATRATGRAGFVMANSAGDARGSELEFARSCLKTEPWT